MSCHCHTDVKRLLNHRTYNDKEKLMKKLLTGLIVSSLLAGGSLAWADALLINGAGATFPYPIYSKWFDEYHKNHPDLQFITTNPSDPAVESARSRRRRLISEPLTGR